MGALSIQDALKSFAGKRVLVTGHTGFKGAWLTFLLKELGADVMGFALAPAAGLNHFELLKLERRMTHVVGDIRDAAAVKHALLSYEPEYVFHLAAQALVRKSYDDPVETFASNVLGSVHVLDAVRQADSVRALVYITSDKCYENVEWVWGYRENDRLGGHDPYSASKAAAEIVFSAFSRSFFSSRSSFGAATARAGNVIGGGDWSADRIVPDCIRAILANDAIQLRNPHATRPWQHVLEPLSGYVLLAACLHEDPKTYGGAWNFGPPSTEVRTVQEVASIIIEHFGRGRVEVAKSTAREHEAQVLQLNCDKARQYLGWRPRWSVDESLAATAQWYKAVMDGVAAEKVTGSQIREYFSELA